MFADIFAILAPVFITTGLGYFWARAGKHFDTNLVTSIVTYFATPCLTFAALATVELGRGYIGSDGNSSHRGQPDFCLDRLADPEGL